MSKCVGRRAFRWGEGNLLCRNREVGKRQSRQSNTDQTGLNRVARLQAVHDEVEERSMGWVEGVGEGIGVSDYAEQVVVKVMDGRRLEG
jgi:hypothetical protein